MSQPVTYRLFVFVFVFFQLHFVSAQRKTSIGIELSKSNEIYDLMDEGNHLEKVPLISVLGGIRIRQELGRGWSLETGSLLKGTRLGFGFKGTFVYGMRTFDPSLLLPLSISYTFNLYKDKVRIIPVLGYTHGIVLYPYEVGGLGYSRSTNVSYEFSLNPNVSQYYSLLQTGIGFEIKLSDKWLLSLTSRYYKGFNTIQRMDISYEVYNSGSLSATATSKGEFWCIGYGLRYLFSLSG